MQDLIEDLIRWLGYFTLRVLTFGRYRGGASNDLLPEGGVGLAVAAGVFWLAYTLMS